VSAFDKPAAFSPPVLRGAFATKDLTIPTITAPIATSSKTLRTVRAGAAALEREFLKAAHERGRRVPGWIVGT
jgi:hypothetical protein